MDGGGDYRTMTELVIDGSIMYGVRGLTTNEGNGWIDTSGMTSKDGIARMERE